MAWRLEGTYFESCSCDAVCPCTWSAFTARATHDRCRALLAYHIDSGEIDDVDVGGLSFALFLDTPPVMSEGNWRVGVFLDDGASDSQAEHLGAVLSGQAGGPPAMLGPLIGEMLGVERAPIEVTDDGLRHAVRVGDVIDFEIQDIVPWGKQDGRPVRFDGMLHPLGVSDLTMAEAQRSRIDAFGIRYEGKTGLSYSDFSWAG
jgi:hypothetical protein